MTTKKATKKIHTKTTDKERAAKTSRKPAKPAGVNHRRKSDNSQLSALDAAVRVLQERGEPMSCRELIDTMAAKEYWKTAAGKTPHATLSAAILREIATKGTDARFQKTERGRFAAKA